MNKFFCIVLVSLVGVVAVNSAKQQRNLELNLMGDIMNNILDTIENKNIPEFKEIIPKARLATHRIVMRYRSCESLHQDDSPSRLQKALKIVCVNMGHIYLGTELFFVIKDFGEAYAKRGFSIDQVYETFKEFILGESNEIFEFIISFLPTILQQQPKQSGRFYEHMLERAQGKFMEALLDLDLDEAMVDVVSQLLFSPYQKYSKPSKRDWNPIDEAFKEYLMEELDLDESTADIMIQYLSSSSNRNTNIHDIIQTILEEED